MLTGGYIPYFGTTCMVLITILIVIIITHFLLLKFYTKYRRFYVETFMFPGLSNRDSAYNPNYKQHLNYMYSAISTYNFK